MRGQGRQSFRLVATVMLLTVTFTSAPLADQAHAEEDMPAASSWIPSAISVETGEIEPGTRFVRTTMMWADVSGFAANSTFELDFLLDNYDASPLGPGTYLDRARNVDQTPAVKRWTSTLPAPYLDTRFGDGLEEIAYSIGSGDAHEIEAGVEYVSLIVIAAGDTDRDSARLSAQLGHQRPAGCASTWCSFDNGPGSIVEVFSAWVIPVPGTIRCGTIEAPSMASGDGERSAGTEESCQPGTT